MSNENTEFTSTMTKDEIVQMYKKFQDLYTNAMAAKPANPHNVYLKKIRDDLFDFILGF